MGILTCTNRFPRPLFLTKMGPYFYIELDVSEDDAQNRDDVEWVNIIGQTADVKDLEHIPSEQAQVFPPALASALRWWS
jgi:hypothetical protein